MATPVTSSAPMVVSVAPDRLILERIVSARQLAVHAPSDYGREEDYSTAGLFDPFASTDTFQEFDPVFVDTSSIGATNGTATNTASGDGDNGQYQENGDGNGHNGNGHNGNGHNGNGNGNGNGHYDNGHDANGGAQTDPAQYASQAQAQPSAIAGFNVTSAPLSDQVHTPFASEPMPTLVTASTTTIVEAPSQEFSNASSAQVSPVDQMSAPQAEAMPQAPPTAQPFDSPQPEPVAQLQETRPVTDLNAPPSDARVNDNGSPAPPPMADGAAENRALENQALMQANTVVVAVHQGEQKSHDSEQFDPTDESPPQRPKVAAPDFFTNGPSTKPKGQSGENGDGDAEAPVAKPRVVQSGPAFDFFASASPGGAPVAKPTGSSSDELRKTSDSKTKAEKNDALSSFENLLAKQSKTGSHNMDTGAREKLKAGADDDKSSTRSRELSRKGRSKSASSRDDDEEEEDDNWDAPKNKKSRRSIEDEEEFDDENDNFTARTAKIAAKTASQTRSLIDKFPAPGKRNDDDDDDDDDYGTSKSKAKKSKLPAALRSRADQDDDADEDDDDEEEQPTRRNFSGGASNSRSLKGGAKSANLRGTMSKRRNSDDDDDEEKGGIEGTLAKLRESIQGGGFEVAGFPISIGHVSLGIFIIGLLFFAITHVMGNLAGSMNAASGGAVSGAGGGTQQQSPPPMMGNAPSVSGLWAIDVAQNGKAWSSLMTLNQSGNQLSGNGGDKFGNYSLTGWMQDGTTIVLKKRYQDPNGRDSGPIINMVGTVDVQQIPMKANGTWNFVKKSGTNFGYLNKASATTVTGQWRSTLRKSAPATGANPFSGMQAGQPMIPGAPTSTSGSGGGGFNIIKFAVGNGVWIALSVGILLIGSSFVLFGPDGLINIWNKQQYIPSQFKSQHGKIRGQLAKALKKGSLPLGQRVEWKWYFPMPWVVKDLALPPELRKINPHVLILGQGGKGKTRLIANMITHDIESNDRAVIAIDSDGTLIDLITRWVAAHPRGEEMAKRVILIDPTNKNNHSSFNPLEMPAKGDIQSAATSIVYGFKAIYSEAPGQQSQWNQQTADILRTSVLLLMANDKTLLDLPALLQDNDFRDIMLESVERRKNERVEFITLLDQWGRYKKLARSDQWITWVEPILNRLNPMLSNPRIRSIFADADGDLKIPDVITGKRILLVKIPQGEFGQDANLLGSLIVSGVKQAALTLSSVSPKLQQEVALYLDNFDNFIEKETIDNITSETKKFKIGLVGVTKSLQHLQEDFRNQLIINVGTLITFALSKKDGDMLGPQMFPIDGRKVKHQTMSNIFNRVNTSPQFELVSDEEKLNIDKIVRQEERTFFCYKMGAEAGLFNIKAHPFDDIANSRVKKNLLQKMMKSSTAGKISSRDSGKNSGKAAAKTSSKNDDDDDE